MRECVGVQEVLEIGAGRMKKHWRMWIRSSKLLLWLMVIVGPWCSRRSPQRRRPRV